MVGETHGQSQMAKKSQHLTALQEVEQIAQLRKRRKAQGQRPQPGERRFGYAPEAVYVEPKPPDPSRINQTPISKIHNHHVVNSRFDYNSFADKIELLKFSGKIGYLRWERNLDEWFHYNNILKEEKLAYAIDHLKGDAFKWWVQEEDDRRFYKEPTIKTWRALKEAMRHEFAPEFTSSEIKELYPRRYPTHGSKEARKVVAQESKRGWSQQANLQPNQGHAIVQCLDQKSDIPKAMESRSVSQNTLIRTKAKPLLDTMQVKAKVSPILNNLVYESSPTGMSHLSLSKNVKTGPEVQQNPNSTSLFESKVHKELFPRNKEILDLKEEDTPSQGKSSDFKILKDQTCFKCHKIGHLAEACPIKHVLKETSLETETENFKISDSFIQSDLLVPNSCIMHLSLSKGIVSGIKEHELKREDLFYQHGIAKEEEAISEAGRNDLLLKEAKPVIKVSNQGKCLTSPLDTGLNFYILGTGIPDESSMLTEVPRAELDPEINQNPHHKWKPKSEQRIVQVPKPEVNFTIDQSAIIISMIRLMHLSCPRECEIFSGTKEEYTAQKEETQSMMLQDAESMPIKVSQIKGSVSNLNLPLLLDKEDIMHLSLPRNFDPGIKEVEVHNHQSQKLQRRQQPKTRYPKKKIILQLMEAIKVSLEISNYFYQCPNTGIMHLLFVQKDEKFSGCKEESFKEIPPDNLLLLGESVPKMVRTINSKSVENHHLQKGRNDNVQARGVIISHFFKEEPPDAQTITKPKLYQGYPVLRSKPSQGGGDDVVIKPVAEPEVNQPAQTGHFGGTSDRGTVPGEYLNHQKFFCHESNFPRRPTHQGFTETWNYKKSFTEEEVMNITNRRFPSPSICENRLLKEIQAQ
ncbi:uncharacterized protein LOC108847265 isoform X2 [Raphanus sativus]|uniref:Uncharacterized protein LOC108847265 isoform X2 n=1 Tax=Raphanus sativus TaxID=3726 RepID=A0A9W3CLT5_RAPSA|nr:uncharacterized protein LOC108847265 isoform X2 [Raphanus sativus]